MHFIRPIGQSQCAHASKGFGQREIITHATTTVGLNCLVQDPLHGARGSNLDGLNLGVRTLVAHRIHQPRRLKDK